MKLFIILLLCVGMTGCNKLLEVEQPPNEVSVGKAFNDSAAAVTAVVSIYHGMILHGRFEWGGLSYFTARSADDIVKQDAPVDFFALDSLLYTDEDVYSMWHQAFSSLLMINTCIRSLQATTRLSPTLLRQLQGEAFFCRAFVNFYLVNTWGDAVPLITSPDVDINMFAKSVPRQRIYEQVMADLQQAQRLLTNQYAGAGRVRPNGMAANALLARVYLYLGRYSDAIALSGTVIGSNLYTPLPSPESAFLQTSEEAIWQLMTLQSIVEPSAPEPVADAFLYLDTHTSLTPGLLAAFEPDDLRRQAWVTDIELGTDTYTTAYKYKRKRETSQPVEYYMVLRAAEQYLIRAEAYARLGQVANAVADLNVVRSRAGLSDLPTSLTPQQCMEAVEQERRVELFSEWGHRWFDLKRWPGINGTNRSRADEVLGALKSDWQSTDQWYPVPQSELKANPYLVQNPGYPQQ